MQAFRAIGAAGLAIASVRPARQGAAAQTLAHLGVIRSCDYPRIGQHSSKCNWGVATGPGSRVFVLDVDGEAGKVSLAALEAKHGPLPVYTHFDYWAGGWRGTSMVQLPGWPRGTQQHWHAGRRLRCSRHRQIVIVPPSIHESGRTYRWADPEQSIADAPSWLPDLLSGNSSNNG